MMILICEDDPTTVLDLWRLLHESGHRVCGIARTATDCLEKVACLLPDLVMVGEDVKDGLPAHSLVTTLAMSGFPAVVLHEGSHAAGQVPSARAVLDKPFSEAAFTSGMLRAERGGLASSASA